MRTGRLRKLVEALALLGLGGGAVAWALGAFHGPRLEPGRGPEPASLPAPVRSVVARRAEVPLFEEAVGTVRSRTRVDVAAQVIARILELPLRIGSSVKAGDLLARLDDREFEARLDQAKKGLAAAAAARQRADQALSQAQARLTQARARNERHQRLVAAGASTPEVAEAAAADFLAAEAGVADAAAAITAADAQQEQAQLVVREAEVALGYTRILAPFDGVVAERLSEPGDLASPGRTLLVLLDPVLPRLEAAVREGLIARVPRGAVLEVRLPTAGATARGTVTEVAPSADPRTRTFLVRVDFDPVPGVYPGMFGRLSVPAGTRSAVLLPRAAVVRVGQLETVLLQVGARFERRLVSTGAELEPGTVEVLAGLAGGETVGLPEEHP